MLREAAFIVITVLSGIVIMVYFLAIVLIARSIFTPWKTYQEDTENHEKE
jgi:hypothetical protein